MLPLLALFAGCSDDDENKPDQITLPEGVSEIVFTPEATADQTLAFSSTAAWTVTLDKSGWVEVVPANGPAGDAVVTVKLTGAECTADREATATITAGSATATFRIAQTAPVFAQSIRIVTPQKKLLLTKTMQLSVEVEPADAVFDAVVWSSSDPSVLAVDSEGTVTALALGKALVSATSGTLKAECQLEATEVFTTDGEGETYSFADLAAMASGVEAAANVYTVTADLLIAAEDTLTLGDNEQIKICDGVSIQVLGLVDFTPETTAEFLPSDEAAVPATLYFTDEIGGGEIRNVTFSGVPIRYFGGAPLTIESCTFKQIVSKYAAINLGGSGLISVSECKFLENAYPAISGGANLATPLLFKNNYLYKNSNDTRNRPQINVTVGGDSAVEIIGNTVIGPGEITMNGGIAVANMLGIGGTNKVLIEGNEVSDCRYGITTNGVMDVRIIDNVLKDNKWESNAMNGGSGVSIYNAAGGQKIYMSGNTITGHLWGITNIGNVAGGVGPSLNMGNLTQGDDYNPGGNIFSDNGNGGVLYDLYNNSSLTVYAQGNTWNVATQDRESIEQVIFHKVDNAQLGEVIFMPDGQ